MRLRARVDGDMGKIVLGKLTCNSIPSVRGKVIPVHVIIEDVLSGEVAAYRSGVPAGIVEMGLVGHV